MQQAWTPGICVAGTTTPRGHGEKPQVRNRLPPYVRVTDFYRGGGRE